MALENLKSAFSNIIVPDLEEYDPNIGGIHGGTPSQPSHPPSQHESVMGPVRWPLEGCDGHPLILAIIDPV